MKIGEIPAAAQVAQTTKQSEPVVKADVKEDVQPVVAVEKVNTDSKEEDETAAMSEELMQKSISQANKTLEMYDKMIERTVHEKTHTIMYTLKDSRTNEIIAEFPPKKIQDMIAKMWELAGLFVDEKA